MVYGTAPSKILKSTTYNAWFSRLRDLQARARIAVRLDRLAFGNPGDVRPIGAGLSELRIDYGPGYRVYFMRRGALIVVLCGGNKRTQEADIDRAKEMAEYFRE